MADEPFSLFYLPFRPALDANGIVVPGASLTFYQSGTTTLLPIYADVDLTVPLANPLTANAAGKWPSIYIDTSLIYRVVLRGQIGETLESVDPYTPGMIGGPPGSTGPADNTYVTYAALLASDPARKSARLVPQAGETEPAGNFSYIGGVWVRQSASGITYTSPVTGAPERALGAAKDDLFTAKDAGATANGTTDDQPAFVRAAGARNDIMVPRGTSRIGTGTIGEFQKPLRVQGTSHGSQIVIDNADKRAFRVGAVGGEFGDFRAITKWDTLTFRAPAGLAKPYALTAIDVQAVFPFTAEDCTFLSLGPDAIKGTNLYYGYLKGLQLVNSGITFSDVNVLSLYGCEFRGDDRPTSMGGEALDAGKPLFGNVGRYPLELIESDQIKMYGGLFEAYHCPIVLLRRAYNTVFNGVWFEGNPSATHLIRWEQAQSLDFINCQLDFAIPYAANGSFISVTMAGPEPNSENVNWRPYIRINGGYLLLTSVPNGDAGRFVSVTNGESVVVEISGLSFRGGSIWADRTVEFDVKSLALTGSLKHNFYSRPNAVLLRGRNSWMPNSVANDWDFASGAGFVSSSFGVGTSTTEGDFLTGTKAAKMTGLPAGATQSFARLGIAALGPVASGQTYVVYARLKATGDVTLRMGMDSGGSDYAGTPLIPVPAGVWRDYIFKTDLASTQALAASGNPNISFSVTNNGSASVDILVDRFDYAKVTGDHVI